MSKPKAVKAEMSRAERATSKAKKSVKANAPVAKVEVKENTPKSTRKLTMSADARRFIKEGHTKLELQTYLQKHWELPDTKIWYVNWYFSDAKRKGFLPKEFLTEMRAEKVPA